MKETVRYISDLSFYIHLSIPYASSVTLISNNATLLLLSPRTVTSISSSFSIEVAEDKTSSVVVQLKNESYGADEHKWFFEFGSPIY